MREFENRDLVLKNPAWKRCYGVASTVCYNTPKIYAADRSTELSIDAGDRFIFDDCGELIKVDQKQYEEFCVNDLAKKHRLTPAQTVRVYPSLLELLLDIPNIGENVDFLAITPGVRLRDVCDDYLHSGIIEEVMTRNQFTRYITDDILDEFLCWIKEGGLQHDKDCYEWFLNSYYFPMKREEKHAHDLDDDDEFI